MATPFRFNIKRRLYEYIGSGRAVPQRTITKLRDQYIDTQRQWATTLTNNLADGSISLAKWEREWRERVKHAHMTEYMLGRGGKHMMTARDYGIVGRRLRDEYKYLRGFAEKIATGEMTVAQVEARMNLYLDNTRVVFERAKAESWGLREELPGYPGRGVSCKMNCRCSWRFEEKDDEIRAYWELGAGAESCDDCSDRARDWSPFIVKAPAQEAA